MKLADGLRLFNTYYTLIPSAFKGCVDVNHFAAYMRTSKTIK